MLVRYLGRKHTTRVVESDRDRYYWECDCGDESESYPMFNFAQDAAIDHERRHNPKEIK